MAHEIDMSNNRANMAFTGETPWHGLGHNLPADADLETWRKAAGMDWALKSAPVKFEINPLDTDAADDVGLHTVPRRNVLYRSDTRAPLSVVSDNYKVTQPNDILEMFDEISRIGGYKMETAGCLKGGAVFWALARTGDSLILPGKDEVIPHLLLASSCDGSMSNTAMLTSTRVVCWNTLYYAVFNEQTRESRPALRIPHSTIFDVERVKIELGLVDQSWVRFRAEALSLCKRTVSKEEAVRFFLDVLYPGQAAEIDPTKVRPALEQLLVLNDIGVGQNTKSAKGTAWGLVNTITRFDDHERKAQSNDTRLQAAWFGSTAALKQRAFDYGLRLVA